MAESLGDFLIKAYNANERGNHYEVKKNLKIAIKMLELEGIEFSSKKSDVIDTMNYMFD